MGCKFARTKTTYVPFLLPKIDKNQSAHLYAYQKLALTGSSSHQKIQQHTFQCQNIHWSCPAIFGLHGSSRYAAGDFACNDKQNRIS